MPVKLSGQWYSSINSSTSSCLQKKKPEEGLSISLVLDSACFMKRSLQAAVLFGLPPQRMFQRALGLKAAASSVISPRLLNILTLTQASHSQTVLPSGHVRISVACTCLTAFYQRGAEIDLVSRQKTVITEASSSSQGAWPQKLGFTVYTTNS